MNRVCDTIVFEKNNESIQLPLKYPFFKMDYFKKLRSICRSCTDKKESDCNLTKLSDIDFNLGKNSWKYLTSFINYIKSTSLENLMGSYIPNSKDILVPELFGLYYYFIHYFSFSSDTLINIPSFSLTNLNSDNLHVLFDPLFVRTMKDQYKFMINIYKRYNQLEDEFNKIAPIDDPHDVKRYYDNVQNLNYRLPSSIELKKIYENNGILNENKDYKEDYDQRLQGNVNSLIYEIKRFNEKNNIIDDKIDQKFKDNVFEKQKLFELTFNMFVASFVNPVCMQILLSETIDQNKDYIESNLNKSYRKSFGFQPVSNMDFHWIFLYNLSTRYMRYVNDDGYQSILFETVYHLLVQSFVNTSIYEHENIRLKFGYLRLRKYSFFIDYLISYVKLLIKESRDGLTTLTFNKTNIKFFKIFTEEMKENNLITVRERKSSYLKDKEYYSIYGFGLFNDDEKLDNISISNNGKIVLLIHSLDELLDYPENLKTLLSDKDDKLMQNNVDEIFKIYNEIKTKYDRGNTNVMPKIIKRMAKFSLNNIGFSKTYNDKLLELYGNDMKTLYEDVYIGTNREILEKLIESGLKFE